MIEVALRPHPPGAPDWWEPKTPLGHARGLLAWRKAAEARALLERALEQDELDTAPLRATALLALALMDSEAGRRTRALRLLDEAEAGLGLKDHVRHPVRWDIALAVAQIRRGAGDTVAAALHAREAIERFENADVSVAWSRPVLLGLRRYAVADRTYDAAFMVPTAIGVLQLDNDAAAWEWLALQKAILKEYIGRGSTAAAALHVSVAMRAIPADLLPQDVVWQQAMQLLGRMGADVGGEASYVLNDAFNLLEIDYEAVCSYESEAPLLPRERVISRW